MSVGIQTAAMVAEEAVSVKLCLLPNALVYYVLAYSGCSKNTSKLFNYFF